MVNLAVIYYSATGNVHRLAQAAAAGAEKEGADVRLRRVTELAPDEVVATSPDWMAHREATADIPEAVLDDLEWADAVLFGTPTRFGLPSAQLKQFIDTTGGLWFQGKLVDKVVSTFTSTSQTHGGQESTILALNNTFYHWGSIIVPTGWADPIQYSTHNGNPYGVSSISGNQPASVHEDNLQAMESQAVRVVRIAAALLRGRAA